VLRRAIAPVAVADDVVPELIRTAGLSVLASGRLPLTTTDHTFDGTRIELPSNWLGVGRPG
jgi:hypothetical protein